MHTNNKHILLISYVFPPYYGIGGRRWAKHASELTKLGYVVHVICAKNPFKEKSLWTSLVIDNPNIVLYQLPTRYPKVLVDFEHTLPQKLMYKFWVSILPFFTRGSFLDRTIFWKRPMLKAATKIIRKNNITHVICTGGPFGVMQFATLLKRRFSDLFLMNDMRDPWTWGPNWGFPNLAPNRIAYERKMEYQTIQDSDVVSVPSDDMRDYLILKYPKFKEKIIRIPHFFDPNEIKQVSTFKAESKLIRFVMYGNIYQDIEPFIKKMVQLFTKYKNEVILDVYTDKLNYSNLFKVGGANNVTFYNQVPAIDLFNKFCNYDFVFLLSPKYNRNNISTKFYEIIYTKTPIFIFCDAGLGSQFLVDNNLGIHANLNTIDEKFEAIVQNRSNFTFNKNFDVDQYSLKNVAQLIANNLTKTPLYNLKYSNLRNVLFTFDYELFLGSKSGTAKNCIIEPTNTILNLLNKYKIKKSLFFVDTIYLMRLFDVDDESAKEDYQLVSEQLMQILRNGHYIFPHIHPHWLEAIYNKESKQWVLQNIEKYRFHNISNEEKNLLFRISVNFIRMLQDKAGIHYDIDAYRAGGWCIQPFQDFKPLFEEYNIKYDFSVLSGFKLLNEKFYYDFSDFPAEKIYRFDEQIEEFSNGGKFTELAITTINFSNLIKINSKILLKILNKLSIRNFGDGIAVNKPQENFLNDDFENSDHANIEMTSVDLLTLFKLRGYKKLVDNNSYVHFITHPKMISRHNLFCFEKYLMFLNKNYRLETDYKEIAKNVISQ